MGVSGSLTLESRNAEDQDLNLKCRRFFGPGVLGHCPSNSFHVAVLDLEKVPPLSTMCPIFQRC